MTKTTQDICHNTQFSVWDSNRVPLDTFSLC